MNRLFVSFVLILVVIVAAARVVPAAVRFPSVAQLRQALSVQPGARLPLVGDIAVNGRAWTAWCVSVRDIGAGRYVIVVQLRSASEK